VNLNTEKIIMDKDTRFALLVIGLPFLGLIYCLGIIALFLFSPLAQNHPIVTGLSSAIVPFTIAASIWIKASAKAYSKKKSS
jgi:hypothetical protein